MEVIGFIANIVGAQAVGVAANQRSMDRILVMKQIETLLK